MHEGSTPPAMACIDGQRHPFAFAILNYQDGRIPGGFQESQSKPLTNNVVGGLNWISRKPLGTGQSWCIWMASGTGYLHDESWVIWPNFQGWGMKFISFCCLILPFCLSRGESLWLSEQGYDWAAHMANKYGKQVIGGERRELRLGYFLSAAMELWEEEGRKRSKWDLILVLINLGATTK